MLVNLIFISFLLCHVRGLAALSFLLSFSMMLTSLVLTDPCGRGGVQEHPREPTRSGGTEPATYPPLETGPASAGRDGAVRPPSIPRNPPRPARAHASKPAAPPYQSDARPI